MNYIKFLFFFSLVSAQAQFVVESSGNVFVGSNQDVVIVDNFQNEGSLELETNGNTTLIFDGGYDNSTGTVNFNDNALRIGSGTSNSTNNVNLDFSPAETVERLIIDKTGGTATGGFGTLNVTESLTMDNGTLDADNVVLVSDATNTAVVENSNPSASASVTIQRFFPARRAFRFLSPGVDSPNTIHDEWQENPSSFTDNPRPGFGTHITGLEPAPAINANIGDDQTNGLDYQPSGDASLFTYNSTSGWQNVSSTLTTIDALTPYRIMIRGDRSIDVTDNNTTPTNTTLETTGDLLFGNQSLSLEPGASDFSLLSNPYHSQVDFNALKSANSSKITDFLYVWDPTVNTRGAYVTWDSTMNMNDNPSSDANGFIQPGQAYFVQNTAASSTLDFTESLRDNTNSQTTVFSTEPISALNIMLHAQVDGNYIVADASRLIFSNDYNDNATVEDALSLPNIDETLGIYQGMSLLTIDKRPEPQNEKVLPLHISNYRQTNYELSFTKQSTQAEVVLEDTYLETITTINNGEVYTFSVDPNIPESTMSNRFNLIFNPTTLSNEDFDEAKMSLTPNPAEDFIRFTFNSSVNLDDAKVEIYDVTGKFVSSHDLNETLQLNVSELSSGVYLTKVKSDDNVWSQKLIKR